MDNKEIYRWYKEHGICVNCHQEEAIPGRVYCPECAAKNAESDRKWYNKKMADPQYRETVREKKKASYQRRKDNGICVYCNNPATHRIYCYECFVKVKRRGIERGKRERWERHEKGLISDYWRKNKLCVRCGKPVKEGFLICEEHYQMACEAGEKGRANQKRFQFR